MNHKLKFIVCLLVTSTTTSPQVRAFQFGMEQKNIHMASGSRVSAPSLHLARHVSETRVLLGKTQIRRRAGTASRGACDDPGLNFLFLFGIEYEREVRGLIAIVGSFVPRFYFLFTVSHPDHSRKPSTRAHSSRPRFSRTTLWSSA